MAMVPSHLDEKSSNHPSTLLAACSPNGTTCFPTHLYPLAQFLQVIVAIIIGVEAVVLMKRTFIQTTGHFHHMGPGFRGKKGGR